MKKFFGIATMLGLLLTSTLAFAGSATIPSWTHGWGSSTFITLVNVGTATVTYTVTLKSLEGTTIASTNSTLEAGKAMQIDTAGSLTPTDDWPATPAVATNLGYGTIEYTGGTNSVVAWAVVWGTTTSGATTGFTVTIAGGNAF